MKLKNGKWVKRLTALLRHVITSVCKIMTLAGTKFSWRNQVPNFHYFKESEIVGLDRELVAMMDNGRHLSGIPWVITNGLRKSGDAASADPNAVKNSAHYRGLAADIRCRTTHEMFVMLKAMFAVGFKRIGVYVKIDGTKLIPSHIHVDIDSTLPPEVAWHTLEA